MKGEVRDDTILKNCSLRSTWEGGSSINDRAVYSREHAIFFPRFLEEKSCDGGGAMRRECIIGDRHQAVWEALNLGV